MGEVQSLYREKNPVTARSLLPEDDVTGRVVSALERIADSLEEMRAATPSRLDQLTASLYAAILVNSGQAETPLHALELARQLTEQMQQDKKEVCGGQGR